MAATAILEGSLRQLGQDTLGFEDNGRTTMARLPAVFASLLHDVEHALVMYAYSFVVMPGAGIYDDAALARFAQILANCHIYIIGLLPIVDFINLRKGSGSFIATLGLLGKEHLIEVELPAGWDVGEEKSHYYLVDHKGQRYTPREDWLISQLKAAPDFTFDVQYVGQAYGKTGERNALARLKSHETLQKIALKGIPDGYQLSLLSQVSPGNMLITMFNPSAQNKDASGERLKAGLDKLFGTDERERIALYEAALIRYFQPKFNKEFRDSFPSTNLKVLRDCYDKDFSAVVAEINLETLPFAIGSNVVAPAVTHIAKFELHEKADRRAFFFDG